MDIIVILISEYLFIKHKKGIEEEKRFSKMEATPPFSSVAICETDFSPSELDQL